MSAVAFDTLEVSQNLEAAGFTPEQASGVAQVLAKTMGDSVVTRHYIDMRLAEMKGNILKWACVAVLLGQTAMIVALVKLL